MQTPFSNDDLLSIAQIMVIGEAQRNPFGTQAEAMMREFLQKWDVLQLPNFDYYCTVSASQYPEASLKRLAAIGKFSCLCLYIDDVALSHPLDHADQTSAASTVIVGSKQAELASLGFLFRSGQLPSAPTNLQMAFYEVRQELLALSGKNTSYFSRFLEAAEQYLVKHSRPTAFVEKAADGTIDLQSYITWRDDDSGMYPHIDLIEFANNFSLPEIAVTHPTLQHLRLACNRVTGLTNDIFSSYKEIVVEESRFNLINVIQESTGVGLKEAVEQAITIVNGYTVDFLNYEKQVPYWDAETDLAIKKYINGLKQQISASWYWQISTPRYRSPHSPFRELRT